MAFWDACRLFLGGLTMIVACFRRFGDMLDFCRKNQSEFRVKSLKKNRKSGGILRCFGVPVPMKDIFSRTVGASRGFACQIPPMPD